MKTLNDFSKEDLIKVIANICDQFQTAHEWKGWGFSEEEAQVLEHIGTLCKDRCVNQKDWNLPTVTHEEVKD